VLEDLKKAEYLFREEFDSGFKELYHHGFLAPGYLPEFDEALEKVRAWAW